MEASKHQVKSASTYWSRCNLPWCASGRVWRPLKSNSHISCPPLLLHAFLECLKDACINIVNRLRTLAKKHKKWPWGGEAWHNLLSSSTVHEETFAVGFHTCALAGLYAGFPNETTSITLAGAMDVDWQAFASHSSHKTKPTTRLSSEFGQSVQRAAKQKWNTFWLRPFQTLPKQLHS